VGGEIDKEKEEFIAPEKRIAIHCVFEERAVGRLQRREREEVTEITAAGRSRRKGWDEMTIPRGVRP
jgi:hypothetical protein